MLLSISWLNRTQYYQYMLCVITAYVILRGISRSRPSLASAQIRCSTRSSTDVLRLPLPYTLESEASRCTDDISSRRRKGKRHEETVDHCSCRLCADPVSVWRGPGNHSCLKQVGSSPLYRHADRLPRPSRATGATSAGHSCGTRTAFHCSWRPPQSRKSEKHAHQAA